MAKPTDSDATATAQQHLPIIDLSSEDEAVTAEQLLTAATEWGFIYVRGVGLPVEASQLDSIFNMARAFFKSPVAEKEECAIGPETQDRGWSRPRAEFTDEGAHKKGDFKEGFNFGEFEDGRPQQPVPSSLLGWEAEIGRFFELCRSLCLRLYQLFAVALKIPPEQGGRNWFASRHDPNRGPSGSIFRLLYYPALEQAGSPLELACDPADELRCSPHTDFGGLTLLFQRSGQAGLEIEVASRRGRRATWLPVAVHPPGTENDPFPPVVVNIGDMLSDWTGRRLRSTLHRVVIPRWRRSDRYSVAFFCHPVKTTRLVPVPSPLIKNGSGEQDRVLTAEEHLKRRLAETYGWKN